MQLVERIHYLGPNLRLESPALELRLAADVHDSERLSGRRESLPRDLADCAEGLGLALSAPLQDEGWPDDLYIAHVLGWLIRSLLIAAGHPTGRQEIFTDDTLERLCLVVEGDDIDSDHAAADLAIRIIEETAPGLLSAVAEEMDEMPLADAAVNYLRDARARAMPAETRAIIRAARRLGISALSLDRSPYEAIEAERRIRPNGMLMLGHCARQRLLDGPVYVDSGGPVLSLLWNRRLRMQGLQRMGVPRVDGPPPAERHRALLLVGDAFTCSFERRGESWALSGEAPHPSLAGMGRQMAKMAGAAAILIELSARDLSAAPGSPQGAQGLVDFNLAPRLDALLADAPERLEDAARQLVEWGFPGGAPANIPIVSVTGTNGKTTTSMITRQILRAAGKRVGLASSRGILIGDKQVRDDDSAGLPGHVQVFDSKEIDVAVLETARGAVATMGFAFDQCDVAVCTNVAEDHIGLDGIHTLEDMARLKLSIIQRARKAVVLNAEDAFCPFMYAALEVPRIGIISLNHPLEWLQRQYDGAEVFCVLAETGEQRRIELHAGAETLLELAVRDIPITFEGRAEFNVENTMQAMIAGHFMGVKPADIVDGVTGFRPGFEQLMGRLNIHSGRQFRVVMDYAHNEAGLKRFLDFASQLEHSGKRVVVCGVPGDRSEQQARSMMRIISGFYDRFVLRPSGEKKGMGDVMQKPRVCLDELTRLGVDRDCIDLAENAMAAVRQGLALCRTGDMLVLHLTSSKQVEAWELVTGWPGNPPLSNDAGDP